MFWYDPLAVGSSQAFRLHVTLAIRSAMQDAVRRAYPQKDAELASFAVITLMAVLSLNLGVLNLLPIPILDGGNILLLAMEGIRRTWYDRPYTGRCILADHERRSGYGRSRFGGYDPSAQ